VRFVVPTSTKAVPDCAITSGTRKSPPISTNSPRETIVSPSRASAVSTSSAAAAQLLMTSASSAPVSSASSASARAPRRPRAPVSVSYSSVQ
jgi:hypothetical protein